MARPTITKLALAKRIAAIVIYGHIALFLFGLVVMLISPYNTTDTAQMILIGSPLLAMVALSAYRFMGDLPAIDDSVIADSSWIILRFVCSSSTLTERSFLDGFWPRTYGG
jgi:hypothetical protein